MLRNMYLNLDKYGWTVGVHGYEPVPTLDPMASSWGATLVYEL